MTAAVKPDIRRAVVNLVDELGVYVAPELIEGLADQLKALHTRAKQSSEDYSTAVSMQASESDLEAAAWGHHDPGSLSVHLDSPGEPRKDKQAMSKVKQAQENFEKAKAKAAELQTTIDERQRLQQERRQVERLIEAHELAESLAGKEARFKELRRELMILLMDFEHEVKKLHPQWAPIDEARQRRGRRWRQLRDHLDEGAKYGNPKHPTDHSWHPEWMPSMITPGHGTGLAHTVSAFLQFCDQKGTQNEEYTQSAEG